MSCISGNSATIALATVMLYACIPNCSTYSRWARGRGLCFATHRANSPQSCSAVYPKKCVIGWLLTLCSVYVVLLFAGCGMTRQQLKVSDLDFTILGEDVIPKELAELIAEKKQDTFQFLCQ